MNKPYVYVTRKIPNEAIELLQEHFEVGIWNTEEEPVPMDVLQKEASKAEGLLVMLTDQVNKELMDQSNTLKAISIMAVGYDNLDVNTATEKGIILTNTPGVLSETTADLAFGLMMDTARRISEGNRLLLAGNWKSWGPMFMAGQDIFGATLGIIGMGSIGEAVAKRAKGFEMKVLYHNRKPKPEVEAKLDVEYRELDKLLQESDFVILLTPLTAETKNLIGARELGLMKSTASFINVSRGATVDEEALYVALKEKRIWGAGLDVFRVEPVEGNNPLLSLDNVVALPHIGSSSIQTRKKMAILAAEGLKDALLGQKPKHTINKELFSE